MDLREEKKKIVHENPRNKMKTITIELYTPRQLIAAYESLEAIIYNKLITSTSHDLIDNLGYLTESDENTETIEKLCIEIHSKKNELEDIIDSMVSIYRKIEGKEDYVSKIYRIREMYKTIEELGLEGFMGDHNLKILASILSQFLNDYKIQQEMATRFEEVFAPIRELLEQLDSETYPDMDSTIEFGFEHYKPIDMRKVLERITMDHYLTVDERNKLEDFCSECYKEIYEISHMEQ